MTRLDQATAARLGEIRDIVRSGVTELTGKPQRLIDPGGAIEYGRRFGGGISKLFPELEGLKDSPGRIAEAIERGKGPGFSRVVSAVRDSLRDLFPTRERTAEKPVIPPHPLLSKKCKMCHVAHGKGAHRFHGQGSFLKTHLWPFKENHPMSINDAKMVFAEARAKHQQGISLTAADRKVLARASQVLRYARRTTAKRNPALPVIYERLDRIEATKGPGHRCDAECKRKGHGYFHDFGPGAVIYGLPDGSLMIRHRQGKRLWKYFLNEGRKTHNA